MADDQTVTPLDAAMQNQMMNSLSLAQQAVRMH
jgi:hypothetical protein